MPPRLRDDAVPRGLAVASAVTLRLIIVIGGIVLLALFAKRMMVVVLPVIIALLLATLLAPLVRWLRERNTLSEREREVLGLVAAGMTAAMVADRLGISIHTVHRHVSNISAKNGTRGLPALIRYAVEHGIVRGLDTPGAADA